MYYTLEYGVASSYTKISGKILSSSFLRVFYLTVFSLGPHKSLSKDTWRGTGFTRRMTGRLLESFLFRDHRDVSKYPKIVRIRNH